MLEVKAQRPDRLIIWTECFVTRVIFEAGDKPRAIGVEFRKGSCLYRAHQLPHNNQWEPGQVFTSEKGEVILLWRRLQYSATADAFRHR